MKVGRAGERVSGECEDGGRPLRQTAQKSSFSSARLSPAINIEIEPQLFERPRQTHTQAFYRQREEGDGEGENEGEEGGGDVSHLERWWVSSRAPSLAVRGRQSKQAGVGDCDTY